MIQPLHSANHFLADKNFFLQPSHFPTISFFLSSISLFHPGPSISESNCQFVNSFGGCCTAISAIIIGKSERMKRDRELRQPLCSPLLTLNAQTQIAHTHKCLPICVCVLVHFVDAKFVYSLTHFFSIYTIDHKWWLADRFIVSLPIFFRRARGG